MAKDTSDRAISAERAFHGLMQPQPQSAPRPPATNGGSGTTGYDRSERNEMQRLIESKQ